jgi:Protein of unknown function (DUF2934)
MSADRHEQIAVRAFFIFENNGEVPNEDWRNWFQAELEHDLDNGRKHKFIDAGPEKGLSREA